ncbi:hypothetical protein [Granulicella sp. S156]|uniref:hypothetical protein n=1 Tax=Granulicella sp. S156 TaxID=1747224 RepID=UPI00131DEB5B|nr:hypothetical protein [Granulicella sp. S156]
MKLFICLITPDGKLRRHFGRGKDGIIPAEAFKRGPLANQQAQPTVAAWTPKAPFSSADLERFLLSRARNHDACILIVDLVWQHYVQDITSAAFIVTFEAEAASGNPQNFFFGISARMLRNFAQLLNKFRRSDDAKLLALPLRNFIASELNEIARLCREAVLSGSLSDDVEQQLAGLRARVRPRQKTSYKTTYAVDDLKRFFAYGLETHAQFATGVPHHAYCEIGGLFRFGVRLDERRHYNVSETEGDRTTIEGNFPDCHDQVHAVTGKTHLNMFANDYF